MPLVECCTHAANVGIFQQLQNGHRALQKLLLLNTWNLPHLVALTVLTGRAADCTYKEPYATNVDVNVKF